MGVNSPDWFGGVSDGSIHAKAMEVRNNISREIKIVFRDSLMIILFFAVVICYWRSNIFCLSFSVNSFVLISGMFLSIIFCISSRDNSIRSDFSLGTFIGLLTLR